MVKIYLDGADLATIDAFSTDPRIEGFTTNPTLMRKSGITDYRAFAREVLTRIGGKPVSFEVLSDDFAQMYEQARAIASWAPNVLVKIPVTNTKGESTRELIESLGDTNMNITAVMTNAQILHLNPVLRENHIVSVFNGRIMDTGERPLRMTQRRNRWKSLWASPRAIHDYYLAHSNGYDIITLTPELFRKLDLRGKDLTQYSVETVKMFFEDGKGLTL